MCLEEINNLIKNSKKTDNENSNSEEGKKRENKTANIKEYRKNYMTKYLNKPGVKERQRECSKKWMRQRRDEETKERRKIITEHILAHGYPPEQDKIEEIKQVIYPDLFPIAEFNSELEELLKDHPSEIEEKKLEDLIWDILNKQGKLTPNRIMDIHYDPAWKKAIDDSMAKRNYQKNEGKKYVPIQN